MTKQLNMPDLKANPHQIESGDWVAMGNKLGQVLEPVKSHICEFWITWSGEKLPINYLASKLIKVDYSGKDWAGTKLSNNRHIKKMVWEVGNGQCTSTQLLTPRIYLKSIAV